jgi:hypothetical protein
MARGHRQRWSPWAQRLPCARGKRSEHSSMCGAQSCIHGCGSRRGARSCIYGRAPGVEHQAKLSTKLHPWVGSKRGARGEAEHEATYISVLRVPLLFILKTGGQKARSSGWMPRPDVRALVSPIRICCYLILTSKIMYCQRKESSH